MPDLSPTIDARQIKVGSAWDAGDDGASANSTGTTAKFYNAGINAIDLSAFGAIQIERYLIEFDTSGITVAPSAATFKFYGKGTSAADVIGVQASFASAGSIVNGDFDSWNESSPVLYTDELTSWNDDAYNEFTLTSTALAAMASLDEFQMIVLEADNDRTRTSAGSGLSVSSGYYMRNADDAANRPLLSYTAALPTLGSVKLDGAKIHIVSGKFLIN